MRHQLPTRRSPQHQHFGRQLPSLYRSLRQRTSLFRCELLQRHLLLKRLRWYRGGCRWTLGRQQNGFEFNRLQFLVEYKAATPNIWTFKYYNVYDNGVSATVGMQGGWTPTSPFI